MKILKSITYYALLCAYFFAAYSIIILIFNPIDKTQSVNILGVIFALAVIGSPTMLTKPCIDKLYPSERKKRHAAWLAGIITVFTGLNAFGLAVTKKLSESELPVYSMNFIAVLSLIIYYRGRKEIKIISEQKNQRRINLQLNIIWKKSIKTIGIAASIILFLLIITNPSLKGFKDFRGVASYGGISRKYNFFVCSIYSDHGSRYFGIAGNFFYYR